jgi:hypothetical protein
MYVAQKNSQTKEADVNVGVVEKPSLSWKTYQNKMYDFSLSYPPDWSIELPEKSDLQKEIRLLNLKSPLSRFIGEYTIDISVWLPPDIPDLEWDTSRMEKLSFQGRQALRYKPDYVSELAGEFIVYSKDNSRSLDLMMTISKGLPEEIDEDALRIFDRVINSIKLGSTW